MNDVVKDDAVDELAKVAAGENMETTVNHTPSGETLPPEAPDEQSDEYEGFADLLDNAEAELDDVVTEITPTVDTPELSEESKEELVDKKEEAIVIPSEEETKVEVTPTPVPEKTEPTQTPEEREAAFAKAREDVKDNLKQHFQLTEEQSDAMLVDPNAAMPEIFAGMYLNMYESLMKGVQDMMPEMISTTNTLRSEAEEAANKFYESWPQLKDKSEYNDTVVKLGNSYRKMYPEASVEEYVQNVGAQAIIALKIPIDGTVATVAAGGGNPFADFADEILIEDDS